MLTKLLIAFGLMALCVAIHAMGIITVFRWMQARLERARRESFWPSTWTADPHRFVDGACCTCCRLLVWAFVYAWRGAMPDFTTAAYFSAVTYTTTGYGDLVLPEEWRLVGGVEALTGILMCGLSTGMFFAVFSDIFGLRPEERTSPPEPMKALLKEIRHNPLLWLLAFVPVVFIAAKLQPEAHTLLFVLSVLAIVPLAALLSHATESVAAKTGDAVGGLLNATLGNLTELVIALTALARRRVHAGEGVDRRRDRHQHAVHARRVVSPRRAQASHAGVQPRERAHAGRPALPRHDRAAGPVGRREGRLRDDGRRSRSKLSVGLAVLLIVAYALGMLFSLKTHRELFGSAAHGEEGEAPWPIGLALATLAGVTVLVALVSEIFVESVQEAAVTFGMTPAFVGFIVVALVGGAAEMASAFSGARKNRLDLSVGIALGSASQIALFVAPVLVLLSYVIGPTPMDLQFWPGAVVMMLIATLTASLVTNSGRSAWFVGVLVLMVYLIFAMTLYLLPPAAR